MTTIKYTSKINSTAADVKTVAADQYEQLCKETGSNYEVLSDDKPIKMYFDIDIKQALENCTEYIDAIEAMVPGQARIILGIATDILCRVFKELAPDTEPMFSVKSANSPKFICSKDKKEKYTVSLHIIVNNIVAMKSDQKRLIAGFNKLAMHQYPSDIKEYTNGKDKLFDEAVYDKNRKLRSVYGSKLNENRPFKIEQGTFEQTCITAFIPEDAFELKMTWPDDPVPTATSAPFDGVSANKYDRMAFELGMEEGLLYTASIDYTKWRNVGFSLRNEFGNTEGWEMFDNFSKLAKKAPGFDDRSKYDVFKNKEFWDSIQDNPTNPLKFASIMQIMKEADPDKFKIIQRKVLQAKNALPSGCLIDVSTLETETQIEIHDKLYISLETLEKGENDVGRHISKTLIKTLVFCNNRWFICDKKTSLWRSIQTPSAIVITTIQTYIDKTKMSLLKQKLATDDEEEKKKLTDYEKKYNEFYKQVGKGAFTNQIIKILQDYLFDGEFCSKLDVNVNKLAFNNGIIDLTNKEFRNGILPSDFITQTIPMSYQVGDKEKTKYVMCVLKKIMNNNDEHLEYSLSTIGHSFTGLASKEKAFYFCVDKTVESKGDNGKSLIFALLTKLMPNYVAVTKSSFLEDGNTKRHKQLVEMKGKRLIWIDEFNAKRADTEFIKTASAPMVDMENEVLFGTMEKIKIMFKIFALTNQMPVFNENDPAIYNRYKQISFLSHFDRSGTRETEEPDKLLFKADIGLEDKLIADYANEIVNIVIDYAHKYNMRGMPKIPDLFMKDTKETQKKNDTFQLWFEDNCIHSGGNKLPLKLLTRQSHLTEKVVIAGMGRLGFVYDKDLRGMGKDYDGKYYKGGFMGCVVKPPEEDETEENDAVEGFGEEKM